VLYVVGRPSLTNARLVAAFRAAGCDARVVAPTELHARNGDVALARLDVRTTLDGVEAGLWRLRDVERAGGLVLNGPGALLNAHDKLATAVVLGRAGVPQPRTAHVRSATPAPPFGPPYVVKPRFGSWGRDVFRCDSRSELETCLRDLSGRGWLRRQGALVQELVPTAGSDLRLVVAGGVVAGAVERAAPPGEWRTNVALGARRRPAEPSPAERAVAVRAAKAIGLDLAGVDLLTAPGRRPVVLEVNGAVDFTPEYGLAGADPFLVVADALVQAPALALAR